MEATFVPVSGTEVPAGVLDVLRAALAGGALRDVGDLVRVLTTAGWERSTTSGAWDLASDPAWSVQSNDQPVGLAVFTQGDVEALRVLAEDVATRLERGDLGAVRPGPPDPDWPSWDGEHVRVSCNVTPARPLGRHVVPAVLHLDVARLDTPREGVPLDVDRARRTAREGSAVERWYLAGHGDLPADLVDVLEGDAEPAVVAALAANAGRRQLVAEVAGDR